MKYLIIALVLILATPTYASNTPDRCFFPLTGQSFVTSQIRWLIKGPTCYVNIDGVVKSMGVGEIEHPLEILDSEGSMYYEGDSLTVEGMPYPLDIMKNDTYGYCLMNENVCYPFNNNYAKDLMRKGVIEI